MTSPLRIAVADDEPDIRAYYRCILPRLGFEVVAVCPSGQELVEQCGRTHPDLVLTDFRMPDMDGLEAARRLNQKAPIPVVLVTAHFDGDLSQQMEGEELPILGVLDKPIKQAELLKVIRSTMERFVQLSRSSTNPIHGSKPDDAENSPPSR